MLKQIEPTRDDEARLLARVYSLILLWSEPDAHAEPRETESTRVNTRTRRAKSEVNDVKK